MIYIKLLNFGSCNIDYVYSLDHIVRAGETESTYSLDIFPGGKGLNQSIAIARAGSLVYHAGCVGQDGDMLTYILAQNGVDVSYLRTTDVKSGHAIIQVNSQGENSIFLYAGSNEKITREFVDSVLESFDEGDIILLQNEISNMPYIVKKAYEKKMQIIFNPSPLKDNLKEIDFNMISYILLNRGEAAKLSGCTSAEDALAYFMEKYPDMKVVLTLGDQGCIYCDKDKKIRQAAYLADVVDTTAAGDTFTGYFVSGLCSGVDCATSLKFASAAAAISVSRNGASVSIPWKDEVECKIKHLRENQSDFKRDQLQRQIEEYIADNLKDASLADLAEALNYSVIYTGSLVKKLTGSSFSELLQDHRCSKAAELLLNTSLPVSEIIDSVGYENKSFFRVKFKNKYGKTPLNYRKNGV